LARSRKYAREAATSARTFAVP